MHVEFWFDPGCPFAWIASRWIRQVTPERGLIVDWRPVSLLLKNDTAEDKPWYPKHRRGRDLLRVVEALRADGQADRIGDFYTSVGNQIHGRNQLDFDVAAILEATGLTASLAAAVDEPAWDEMIEAAMADGATLVGEAVASPLIALEGRSARVGFFGPVLTELPTLAESLDLWDGLAKLAAVPGFWELKRQRTVAPTVPLESPPGM